MNLSYFPAAMPDYVKVNEDRNPPNLKAMDNHVIVGNRPIRVMDLLQPGPELLSYRG